MTGAINLLPPRYAERLVERRQIKLVAAALVVLLALLTTTFLAQARSLDTARSELDIEKALTSRLQARRSELAPFDDLADGVVRRERLLTVAMSTEVSWARVLAGLSAAFPADASLVSFSAESILPAFGGGLPAPVGDTPLPIGSATYSGYSVAGFDPGLVDALRRLETVPGLSEPTLQVGSAAEIGGMPVTTFDGTTFLDTVALSGRYVDGLRAGERG